MACSFALNDVNIAKRPVRKPLTTGAKPTQGDHMWRVIKFLLFALIFAMIALVGYAYVGPLVGADFSAPQETVVIPLEFSLD